jgi:hypothetical protein
VTAVAVHPAWCGLQSDVCDPGHCFSEQHAVTATIGDLVQDDEGTGRHRKIVAILCQEQGDCRPAGLPQADSHTILVGHALEGWTTETYVTLTLEQAEEVRAMLGDLIVLAREGAQDLV